MSTLSWYRTGTVQVVLNSQIVTGTGTLWLQNVDPREGFRGPDGITYEIASVDSNTQITLAENYRGGSTSGQPYVIVPLTGYERSLASDTATLVARAGAFLNLNPNDLDILQYRSGAWTVRSPAQYATDQSNAMLEVSVASASTVDLGAQTCPWVTISGTVAITSFGNVKNCYRFVRWQAATPVTYSSTLVLIGGGSATFAAGDWSIFKSDNSATPIWREISRHKLNVAPHAAGFSIAGLTNPRLILASTLAGEQAAMGVDSAAGWVGMLTSHKFQILTNNVARITVMNSGQVAVGSSYPATGSTCRFKVPFTGAGTEYGVGIYADTQTTGTRALEFFAAGSHSGNVAYTSDTSVSFNTSSDERLKNKLKKQTDYRAAIKNTWVGDFEWRHTPGKKVLGVIAQQAYEHFPQGIHPARDLDGDPTQDPWSADHAAFGLLAFWGVKDLYNEVEQIKQALGIK
jgi:hypothetical protein